MNRPKQQGTAFETKIVREADARPHLEAQRAPNNVPGRDVEIRLSNGEVIPIEAKDRANLNVHKLLAGLDERTVVVWSRKSRKGDNTRRSADGPTVAVLRYEEFLQLLDILSWLMARTKEE